MKAANVINRLSRLVTMPVAHGRRSGQQERSKSAAQLPRVWVEYAPMSRAACLFSGHPGTTQSQKKPVLRLVPITCSVVIDARVRAVHARALCA